MSPPAGSSSEAETSRIFVGGLGEAVTAPDLERTFSALGKVSGVEVVRTKGRSFAYLDFVPSTDKSMGKLFSMYNGCMWKGGRLKIEKAKEHYLVRLKREWEQDASLVEKDSSIPNDTLIAKKAPLGRLKKGSFEEMQLHIYFPKLKKVKGLPFSGTGKHKYSFQRIDVPSTLPVHYCDCEEHSGSAPRLGKGDSPCSDADNGGINNEELKVMNSVMNKLFGREEPSEIENDLNVNENSFMGDDDNLLYSGEEDQSMDDDLVINIMTAEESRIVDSVSRPFKEAFSSDKPQEVIRSLESKTKPARKKLKSQKMSDHANTTKDMEARLHKPGAAVEDFTKSKLKQRQLSSNAVNSEISARDESKGKSKPANGPMRGALWVQKSSWKDLVDGAGSSLFSISDILS